jgi:hypothetical protein
MEPRRYRERLPVFLRAPRYSDQLQIDDAGYVLNRRSMPANENKEKFSTKTTPLDTKSTNRHSESA